MRIYIASHVVAYKVQASSIDTQLTLTPGTYKTVVQAWDRCGNLSKRAVNITVAPTGLKPARFVYVADRFAKLWGFNANPSNGVLSQTAQGPVFVNDQIKALAADKGGYRLYGAFGDTTPPPRGGIYAYFIDRRNGHLNPVPGSPFSTAPWGCGAIAVHPSGKFVFVGTISTDFSQGILVFAVNADGSLTQVNDTPIPIASGVTSLAPDRWGRYLYVATASSIEAYAIDQSSGALTPIPGSPYPIPIGSPDGPLVDLYGRFLYTSLAVPQFTPEAIRGFAIAGKTGTLTELPGSPFPFDPESTAQSLAVEPSGRFLYVSTEGQGSGIAIYSINAGNGALTLLKSLFHPDIPCVVLRECGMGNLTADPSGKFLYFLTNSNSNGVRTGSVGAFAIDPVTGDVSLAFQPIALATPSDVRDMVITP